MKYAIINNPENNTYEIVIEFPINDRSAEFYTIILALLNFVGAEHNALAVREKENNQKELDDEKLMEECAKTCADKLYATLQKVTSYSEGEAKSYLTEAILDEVKYLKNKGN